MSVRTIAVFTSTRADYGLLSWIIRDLHEADDVDLRLLVGGTHLLPEFGHTVDVIEAEGYPIAERLDFLGDEDTRVAMGESMGRALTLTAQALERQRPDLLVVLGDRFETLAAVSAALALHVPVAHLHGGEVSEGAIDDAARHAITKLSHLHFTSTEEHRERVIRMGEQPDHVFNVGAPGIDSFVRFALLGREELLGSLDLDPERPFIAMTYHPETLAADSGRAGLEALLGELDAYPEHQVVATYPNVDAGGRSFIEIMDAWAAERPDRVRLVKSLGQLRYLSSLRHAAAVIGNSSSALIEAPTAHVPSLDVGDRQKGRLAAPSVLHAEATPEGIRAGLAQALSAEAAEAARTVENPYGDGHASARIVEVLRTFPLEGLLMKTFHDQEVAR